MCLSTVDFALHWDDQVKDFVGYGWKYGITVPKRGKWYLASGTRYSFREKLKDTFIISDDDKAYPPGFHIFLEKEDAENYGSDSSRVYRVAYRNVLAFGANECNRKDDGSCVIAKEIYYFTDKQISSIPDNLQKRAMSDSYYVEYAKECSCVQCKAFRKKYPGVTK